jgi:hypothetical protein
MSTQWTGKVIEILPGVSGTGEHGPWRIQKFILDIPSQYPQQLCIELWGDKIEEFRVSVGETLTAHTNICARKSNKPEGCWFNNIRAWRIEREGKGQRTGSSREQPPRARPSFIPTREVEVDNNEPMTHEEEVLEGEIGWRAVDIGEGGLPWEELF